MRAVIFDFDGTIADSFKVVLEIAHSMTGRDELVNDAEVVRLRKMRMLDVAKSLRIPKWRWPLLLFIGRRQMTKRLGEVHAYEGMGELLAALQADKYQLYIMSSNSKRNVERFLTVHGLGSYFIQIYGGVGLLSKAPALRKILRQHQIPAREAMYIGDEPRDIEAAKRVDMPCVAVAWGYNDPEVLNEHAPMMVVRSVKQLQSVIQSWGEAL